MIKHIDTGKCQLIAVEVPAGAYDFKSFNEHGHTSLECKVKGDTETCYLDMCGSYTIIGKVEEITEEQAAELLLEHEWSTDDCPVYHSWDEHETHHYYALEAFGTLLTSHGITTNHLILKKN